MAISLDNNNPDINNNVKKYLAGIRIWSWIVVVITSIQSIRLTVMKNFNAPIIPERVIMVGRFVKL